MNNIDIGLAYLFEIKNINYLGEEIEIFHFKETIFVALNTDEDKFIHLSGKFSGRKTREDFYKESGEKYKLKLVNINYLYNQLKIKNIYDMLDYVNTYYNKYQYYIEDKSGDIDILTNEHLRKLAGEKFKKITYLPNKLKDYNDESVAIKTLSSNINAILKNGNYEENKSYIDNELDKYNDYVKNRGKK